MNWREVSKLENINDVDVHQKVMDDLGEGYNCEIRRASRVQLHWKDIFQAGLCNS